MASPAFNVYNTCLRAIAAMIIAVLLVVAGGCSRDVTKQASTHPPSARDDVPQVSARSSERGVETRRDHDRLISAYAPVSDHASSIAAAGVLYANQQIDTRSYLQIINGYERSLRGAQRALRSVNVHDAVNARQSLLSAIASRIDALNSLSRSLDVRDREGAGSQSSAQYQERYRSAWGASIGAARQATNLVQSQRQDAGLEPLREDAFR